MKMCIKEIKRKSFPVLQHADVLKAAIFGSFARGEETRNSDIDIIIEFRGKKSLFDLANLKIELEELLNRKVDVLTYNSLHPLLRDRIISEQKPIL